jgi:flagellar hook-length control protein FliK
VALGHSQTDANESRTQNVPSGNAGANDQANGPGGAAGTASPADAAAAQSNSLISLALVEGSDATGASAQALQSAQAAAAAPAVASTPSTPLPGPAPVAALPGTTGVSSSSTAAAISASALSGGGDARGHGGADAGSDSGGGNGSWTGPGTGGAGGDGAAALQQLGGSQATSPADATPAPTVRVQADVDSAEFPQAVADRVSFAVGNGWSSAKLSVNPPQLGPIELQIAIQGEHAQVAMSTHSAVTREALETSAPKLKEMLNSQGFTQVSVDISQRSFQERSSTPQQYTSAWTSSGSSAAAPASAASAAPRAPQGMLDAYA